MLGRLGAIIRYRSRFCCVEQLRIWRGTKLRRWQYLECPSTNCSYRGEFVRVLHLHKLLAVHRYLAAMTLTGGHKSRYNLVSSVCTLGLGWTVVIRAQEHTSVRPVEEPDDDLPFQLLNHLLFSLQYLLLFFTKCQDPRK